MFGFDQFAGVDVAGLGARFGLSPEQAAAALAALMPAVLGGFHRQAAAGDPAGLADAAQAVGTPDAETGNAILDRIFGSKEASRQVADQAAGQSGVSSAVLQAMLPIVAAMIARHVAANGGQNAGLGGMLANALGGGGSGGGGGLGGLFGGGADPLGAILGGLRR